MPHHTPQTLLIAATNVRLSTYVGDQLTADGHVVHMADSAAATTRVLAAHAIDALVLAELEDPAAAPRLLRELRAGALDPRVHPAQPVVTLGAVDTHSTLRAYESGSDHHLPADTDYLVLRAVLDALERRATSEVTSRHVYVDTLHLDTAARAATVAGEPVRLSRIEFDLLSKLASDPTRVFTKAELKRAIGRDATTQDRTLDSHACRLRKRLTDAGAHAVRSRWGVGYSLLDPEAAR